MRKTKEQKGITLIALIITIIVLLILAVVAIRAIQGDGIVQQAKNARSEYEQSQAKESATLDEYLNEIEDATKVKWTQNGATLTRINEDGTKTQVKIGDYVNYNEGSYTHTPDTAKGAGTSQTGGGGSTRYTLGTSTLTTEDLSWRVLGVNKKGELELISADPTTQSLYLANDEGYINAEDNLNNYCKDLYGKGEYATGARSLNVDDINKLINYDPTTNTSYGEKWTYRYPTTEEVSGTRYMQYRTDKADGTQVTDWTNITFSGYQKFRLPEQTTFIDSSNPGTSEPLESIGYHYNIANNLTTDDGFTSEEATEISNMITKGTTSSNIAQWLATRIVSLNHYYARFCVHRIDYEREG